MSGTIMTLEDKISSLNETLSEKDKQISECHQENEKLNGKVTIQAKQIVDLTHLNQTTHNELLICKLGTIKPCSTYSLLWPLVEFKVC
jgi:hypothetical protein